MDSRRAGMKEQLMILHVDTHAKTCKRKLSLAFWLAAVVIGHILLRCNAAESARKEEDKSVERSLKLSASSRLVRFTHKQIKLPTSGNFNSFIILREQWNDNTEEHLLYFPEFWMILKTMAFQPPLIKT